MCVCVYCKAQKDAGECHIKIPVITFDSPEEERQKQEEGEEASGSEKEDTTPKHQRTTSQSEEFHLCRETSSPESSTLLERTDPDQERHGLQTDSTPSPQQVNDNSSSGIDVHSHPDDTDPLEPNVDSRGFLRLPPAVGRYGPGGRTHIRGLSMDSGKDLLSERTHNTVRCCFYLSHYKNQNTLTIIFIFFVYILSEHHDQFQIRPGGQRGTDSQ